MSSASSYICLSVSHILPITIEKAFCFFQTEHKTLCQCIGKDGACHPSQASLDQAHMATMIFSYFVINTFRRQRVLRTEKGGGRERFCLSGSEKLASPTGSTKCLMNSQASGT